MPFRIKKDLLLPHHKLNQPEPPFLRVFALLFIFVMLESCQSCPTTVKIKYYVFMLSPLANNQPQNCLEYGLSKHQSTNLQLHTPSHSKFLKINIQTVIHIWNFEKAPWIVFCFCFVLAYEDNAHHSEPLGTWSCQEDPHNTIMEEKSTRVLLNFNLCQELGSLRVLGHSNQKDPQNLPSLVIIKVFPLKPYCSTE